VAAQHTIRVMVFRVEDQRKGDPYWLRSGNGGINCESPPCGLAEQSCGIGVSKVRYW
jgi:hypothetical protein